MTVIRASQEYVITFWLKWYNYVTKIIVTTETAELEAGERKLRGACLRPKILPNSLKKSLLK